jgi:hypothetical protein
MRAVTTVDEVRRILCNPIYAIEICPVLVEAHELLISEDKWIAMAVKDIEEFGAEDFLRTLLDVLKGNYV